ncbi:MAG: cytochrome P450 [Gammaproteobacteria bacterium]|nr:cytochrome P450 [Gammaproteobacteria bacterium]
MDDPIKPAQLGEINLFDPEVQECPYPTYGLLRREAPVWQDPASGFFVVTRFEDIRRILRDPVTFSSDRRKYAGERADGGRAARMTELYQRQGWLPAATLGGRDDPEHKQMRAMYEAAFSPKRIKALDPFVEELAYRLIDAFVEAGTCEWVRQFAVPLPLITIGKQMGVNESEIWKIKAWTDAWVQRLGMMQTEEQERCSVEMEIEAQHHFQPIFERLRQTPDDTLLSELVNRPVPEWGRTLTDNELHAEMMADTFVGGSETSTNALSAGIMLLGRNRMIWDQLRADPDRRLKAFIEEVLRLESPVQGLFRLSTREVELAGVTIPAGAIVNIRYAAANRDACEFVAAEQIRLDREKPGHHLAFGSGTHHCLGAPLARRELYWGFKAFLDRIDDFELIEERNDFRHQPNFCLRALESLHIRFTSR